MSPARLFRHHSGRMEGSARWYLAVLVMLSLGLLAAHFSVQEHVQKNMRQAVHDWLLAGGGSVQHVRYHLLRGALTLEQVYLPGPADSGMTLDVKRIFIHTSSRAMASSEPSFSLLRFEQPQLVLRRSSLLAWLRGDAATPLFTLTSLLSHARSVEVSDMAIDVLPDNDASMHNRMRLHHLSGRFAADGMQIEGDLGGGRVELNGRVGGGGVLNGRLSLRALPLETLQVLTGALPAQRGVSASGDFLLSGDWQERGMAVQGMLALQANDDAQASMGLRGGWSASGALLNLSCEQVPLAGLPLAWPEVAGRRLMAGRLSGELHLERALQQEGWEIGLNGNIRDVRLESPALPVWRLGELQFSDARFAQESGTLIAGRMLLSNADIGLNAFNTGTSSMQTPVPEIASLKLQDIRPLLHFSDGTELILPEFEGEGRVGRAGFFHLTSVRRDADGVSGSADEHWKLVSEGDGFGTWHATLKAAFVPVVRLRPLLPDIALPGGQGVPEYNGYADFSLLLASTASGLNASGNATLHDLRMMQGGDQLSATRIDIDIDEAGSDGARRFSRLAFDDWHYQMALRPLPRLTLPEQSAIVAQSASPAIQPDSSAALQQGPTPDLIGMPALAPVVGLSPASPGSQLNWEFAEISAVGGRISLGQPDALIAENLLVRLNHLAGGHSSAYTLSGEFGGGELFAQGKMQLQPAFRLTTKARVSHALPFVFNDWMHLSGMPHFVRGRLDGELQITGVDAKAQSPDAQAGYRGKLAVSLQQGALETGAFPQDPMLQRTGYSTRGLLERLSASRRMTLPVSFKGDWDTSDLAATMGAAGLEMLKKRAGKSASVQLSSEPQVNKLIRLRLQGKRGFSHNERVRLRQMAKVLIADRALIVELKPQLGSAALDASMIERVLFSQRLVEQYLRSMGVAGERIFPVWPQTLHQRGDAPGLLLQARAF